MAGGPPDEAEPAVTCPACDAVVSLRDAVAIGEGEAWFVCPDCGHRQQLDVGDEDASIE